MRDPCVKPRLARSAWSLVLSVGALSACGYIDYEYLPEVTESEAETSDLALNAGSAETETEAGATANGTATPNGGTPTTFLRSLDLTPGAHAIDIALAGDPLPAGYSYALRRSAASAPTTPAAGVEVCASCAAALTDTGLSSALTYAYAGFVYDEADQWVDTMTASEQPFGDWGAGSGQLAFLKAAALNSGDRYGWSIDLDATGSTLVVGALGESSSATGVGGDATLNDAPDAGAAYVYTRTGDAWAQQAYVKASNAEATDDFGFAVALSGDGNTLAVSAPREDSGAAGINGDETLNNVSNAGAVYVFVRTGATWSQQAYLKHSHPDANDRFGGALSLSADGNTLAIGVDDDSGASGINGDASLNNLSGSGAVLIFTRSAGVWAQQAYLKASNPGAGDSFGRHLSLSADGDTVAAGATAEDSSATGINGDGSLNGNLSAGAAYVFHRAGAVWSQQAYVKPAAISRIGDSCGRVALSANGDVLAFSCISDDSGATGVGGDPLRTDASGSGAVHIVERSGSAWAHASYIKASNTGASDAFGWSLDISDNGNTLLVGAVREDSSANGINGDQSLNDAGSSGAAYLFTRDATWSQQAYLKASNSDGNDDFGNALRVSGDGAFLAIGAEGEGSSSAADPTASSDDEASSGALYLFAR